MTPSLVDTGDHDITLKLYYSNAIFGRQCALRGHFHRRFGGWWDGLTIRQQEAVAARVELLRKHGPALGRPLVDRITSSAFHNMKELRWSSDGALRALFAFDPHRQAILLVGGDKTGDWDDWYRRAIPQADELYKRGT